METASIEKQIKEIEDEIFKTQKNKATEHHIGKLKAKLAQLRDTLEKRKISGGRGKGFAIKKSGNATVGIVGFPSVGKSTLLNQLTDAKSRVGDYDFTTLTTIPGMMKYNGADIQFLDLPGLITGASQGKGRGREILSAIRSVDMVLLMIDGHNLKQLDVMEKELYNASLRLNQKKPDVVVAKKGQGGITVNSTIKLTHLNENVVKAISSEYVINADITIREDITEDQLIDVFMGNRVYVPALVVINKKDLMSEQELQIKLESIKRKGWEVLAISARDRSGLEDLKRMIFQKLNLIRVYMKPVGKQADYNEPMILRNGDKVEDACEKLHRDFKRKFRYATVSGPSVKHAVQKVGLEHVLKDGDVLTIVIQK
ncbi:MAG: GTP-binding protein [Candidatus Thermoplasmatota archaeon]|jgi:small GTP-binding protein|nr:GTP-binding protein [Candidatus Thermoplasmatota archaeon]